MYCNVFLFFMNTIGKIRKKEGRLLVYKEKSTSFTHHILSLPPNPPRSPVHAPAFPSPPVDLYSRNSKLVRSSHAHLSRNILPMAALYTLVSSTRLSVSLPYHRNLHTRRRFHFPLATLASSSSPDSSASSNSSSIPVANGNTLSNSYGTHDKVVDDNSSLFARFFRSTESNVERVNTKPNVSRILTLFLLLY